MLNPKGFELNFLEFLKMSRLKSRTIQAGARQIKWERNLEFKVMLRDLAQHKGKLTREILLLDI